MRTLKWGFSGKKNVRVNLVLCPRCHTSFGLSVNFESELGCSCGWRPTREICHVCGCFSGCEGHYAGQNKGIRRVECEVCMKVIV